MRHWLARLLAGRDLMSYEYDWVLKGSRASRVLGSIGRCSGLLRV